MTATDEAVHVDQVAEDFAPSDSDLIDCEATAGESLPLTEIDQRAQSHLGRSKEETDASHLKILMEIIGTMLARGIAVDAVGNFRDKSTWARVACDPVAFAEDIAFRLRTDGQKVDAGRVGETLRTIARNDAGRRRRELMGQFLGKPASKDGEREVRRWIRAVTGEERTPDIEAFRHWLWLVKNRAAGRHGERHLMLVVFGATQGSGKSVAVMKLCAIWHELFDPDLSIEAIVDERNAPHLAECLIGFWDELGGLLKAEMEKVKHRMTAPSVAYRPMRSNQRIELPMLMSFIAATNRSIAEMVKDSTGMRRFYEIRAADRIDWAEINAIDYSLLWQAVSEDEAAPGVVHRDLIAQAQAPLVWRDPVQRWIDDEDDAGWDTAIDNLGMPLGRQDPAGGIPSSVLYSRFRAWCQTVGEREIPREIMGRRLSSLGWELYRLPRSQGQGKGYRRSVIEKTAEHTVHSRSQPVA